MSIVFLVLVIATSGLLFFLLGLPQVVTLIVSLEIMTVSVFLAIGGGFTDQLESHSFAGLFFLAVVVGESCLGLCVMVILSRGVGGSLTSSRDLGCT